MEHHFGMDKVNIYFLNNKKQPLIISPRWDPSLSFLCSFLRENRTWIDETILRHGAVLIRGFEVKDGATFERAIMSYQPSLNCTYRGTSPRNKIKGTTSIFSAAEVPVNFPIAQHLEMSFLSAPPRQLYFGCLKESQTAGGETALCNFKQIIHDLPDDLCQKLLEKKLKYTRRQRRVGNKSSHDVSDQNGWSEIFKTTNKEDIKQMCKEEGEEVYWDEEENFISTWLSEPFQLHPVTNEPVWFNHIQVFHWTTFPAELFHAFLRTWDLRFLMRALYLGFLCIFKYALLQQQMSLNITYGDGTPISFWEMSIIRNAIYKNMVYSRWKEGDILLLDNFSTSHGRQPTYDKGRKVVVCWSNPLKKSNALKNCVDAKSSIFQGREALHSTAIHSKFIDDPVIAESHYEQDTLTGTDFTSLIGSIDSDTLKERDFARLNLSSSKALSTNEKQPFITDPSFWKMD